jgi:nephrocystin-3
MATQEFRLFVSSTFRDLQAERDELIKKVFPRIRKECHRRGVEFTEIDLRWGIILRSKLRIGISRNYR